jgi:hypothetical protein
MGIPWHAFSYLLFNANPKSGSTREKIILYLLNLQFHPCAQGLLGTLHVPSKMIVTVTFLNDIAVA